MIPPHLQAQLKVKESKLERRLSEFVRRRVDAAAQRWSGRYDRWREAERLLRAFRPSDLDDQRRKEDPLTDGVEKIVVPYSHAVVLSTLAFFMSVFTQRRPTIPVEGMGAADARAAMLMEALLDRQMESMQPAGVLVLYQWLLDSLRYGIGIIKNIWTVREWPEMIRKVTPIVHPLTGQRLGIKDDYEKRDVTAYEGNEALNVSPFNWLPDPNVPLADFQRGEFVVHRVRRSWTDMRQKSAQGMYVGIEHIPRRDVGGSGFDVFGSPHSSSDLARTVDLPDADRGAGTSIDAYGEPWVDLDEVWAYVDPDVLGLLDGQDDDSTSSNGGPTEERRTDGVPELWVFTLANKARVIRAEPANLPGRRFPFEIIEMNYDVHSPANFGMIETFRGLQYHLSWLFNSRMLNVMKTLNNEYVVDPSLIEEVDLLSPGPGRLLRLKEQAWNSGKLKEAVQQLNTNDVTATHHQDAKVITDLIETVTGANRLVMGLPNTGRRAATEVQGQLNLSSGRMKLLVELVRRQGMQPWAGQMARNTQTFLGEMGLRLKPPYDRVLGAPYVRVSPEMLQGEFTFPIGEEGIPTDKLLEANTFKEILMMGIQSGVAAPMMAQFPWMQILGRFLHAMGIKDLQSWGLSMPQLTLEPMEQVAQQVQQGGLLPAEGGQAQADGFALPPSIGAPNMNGNLSGR